MALKQKASDLLKKLLHVDNIQHFEGFKKRDFLKHLLQE